MLMSHSGLSIARDGAGIVMRARLPRTTYPTLWPEETEKHFCPESVVSHYGKELPEFAAHDSRAVVLRERAAP